MVENKILSNISKGKKVFISYLDDNDKVVNGYVALIEINDFVTFQTNQNIIRIPSTRILKIKEKIES